MIPIFTWEPMERILDILITEINQNSITCGLVGSQRLTVVLIHNSKVMALVDN